MVNSGGDEQAEAMGVSAQHTSVARWESEPPAVDSSGREYVVLSAGAGDSEARAVADGWVTAIERLGRPLRRYDGDDCARVLDERLAGARVGLRVMAAGPELTVLDVLRTARAAGAIDEELRLFVTDARVRRVQCPHCHEHTEGEVAIGGVLPCSGCGRRLFVYHHVSRLHGAYLGFMVDAEELPS
jgi:dimethylamine monooxygenase subunit C